MLKSLVKKFRSQTLNDEDGSVRAGDSESEDLPTKCTIEEKSFKDNAEQVTLDSGTESEDDICSNDAKSSQLDWNSGICEETKSLAVSQTSDYCASEQSLFANSVAHSDPDSNSRDSLGCESEVLTDGTSTSLYDSTCQRLHYQPQQPGPLSGSMLPPTTTGVYGQNQAGMNLQQHSSSDTGPMPGVGVPFENQHHLSTGLATTSQLHQSLKPAYSTGGVATATVVPYRVGSAFRPVVGSALCRRKVLSGARHQRGSLDSGYGRNSQVSGINAINTSNSAGGIIRTHTPTSFGWPASYFPPSRDHFTRHCSVDGCISPSVALPEEQSAAGSTATLPCGAGHLSSNGKCSLRSRCFSAEKRKRCCDSEADLDLECTPTHGGRYSLGGGSCEALARSTPGSDRDGAFETPPPFAKLAFDPSSVVELTESDDLEIQEVLSFGGSTTSLHLDRKPCVASTLQPLAFRTASELRISPRKRTKPTIAAVDTTGSSSQFTGESTSRNFSLLQPSKQGASSLIGSLPLTSIYTSSTAPSSAAEESENSDLEFTFGCKARTNISHDDAERSGVEVDTPQPIWVPPQFTAAGSVVPSMDGDTERPNLNFDKMREGLGSGRGILRRGPSLPSSTGSATVSTGADPMEDNGSSSPQRPTDIT